MAQIPTPHKEESTSFWWDDLGLIVLQAEETLFRASCTILRRESTVFADMLSVPQGDTSQVEMHDGHPYVRLYDTAHDVSHFLEATHNYREYYESERSSGILGIAAILRLSTKYDVPHLRKRSIDILKEYYPTTLRAFDNRKYWNCTALPEDDGADILALNVARETNALHLLPAILYDVTIETPVDEILNGKVKMDSVRSDSNPTFMINDSDKALCLATIPQLIRQQLRINHSILEDPNDRSQCTDQNTCRSRKLIWLQHYGLEGLPSNFGGGNQSPLFPSPLFQGGPSRVGWQDYERWMCASCVSNAKRAMERERRELWKVLPQIFGLPAWDKLLEGQGVQLEEDYGPLPTQTILFG